MNKLFRVALLLPFFVGSLFAHVNVHSYKSYVDSLLPGTTFGMSLRSVKMGREIGNDAGNGKLLLPLLHVALRQLVGNGDALPAALAVAQNADLAVVVAPGAVGPLVQPDGHHFL